MKTLSTLSIGFLLAVGGCSWGSSEGPIVEAPSSWKSLVGDTVVVQGMAANNRLGPGVRLRDGTLLLLQSNVAWGTAVVGRPVEVTGEIVSVLAHGETSQALRPQSWKVIKQTEGPR
jgi:hypothetical protein